MSQTCSFCGRGESEVSAFFRPSDQVKTFEGAALCICDRCIEACHKRLSAKPEYAVERPDKHLFREWLTESVTETLIRAVLDLKYRDTLVSAFAERAQLAKVDPSTPPEPVALQLLPADFERQNRILPWRIEGDHLIVAFYNPLHLLDIYDKIVRTAGMPIRPALLGREDLLAAMDRYVGSGA